MEVKVSKGAIGVIIALLGVIGVLLLFGGSPKLDKNLEFSSLNDLVGKPAPNFQLEDQSGERFSLTELKGKKIVLFFNEGIMCYPACWNQVAALGSDQLLNNGSTVAASIVVDNPQQWSSAFKKMPELNKGKILFDTDKTVSTAWGMLSLPSSMHKGSMPGHTYIIIDQQGLIRYTKDDPQMGVRNSELAAELKKI